MTEQTTNLRKLRVSRKKPEAGDVFVMQLPDGVFLPGLVVGAELERPLAPMTGSYLIYVYDLRLDSKAVDLSRLRPDRLLIPPAYTNRLAWTKGYFETVDRMEIRSDVLVSQYCFWDVARGRFVDDMEQPLRAERQPSGSWGLVSYRRLDDLVSDAVGIPRVPEDA